MDKEKRAIRIELSKTKAQQRKERNEKRLMWDGIRPTTFESRKYKRVSNRVNYVETDWA